MALPTLQPDSPPTSPTLANRTSDAVPGSTAGSRPGPITLIVHAHQQRLRAFGEGRAAAPNANAEDVTRVFRRIDLDVSELGMDGGEAPEPSAPVVPTWVDAFEAAMRSYRSSAETIAALLPNVHEVHVWFHLFETLNDTHEDGPTADDLAHLATEALTHDGWCGAWRSLVADCREAAVAAGPAQARALEAYAEHLEGEMLVDSCGGPPCDELRETMTAIADGLEEWPPAPVEIVKRPRLLEAIAIVLADGPLSAGDVLAALDARGWTPCSSDNRRYIAYFLNDHPDRFERVRGGLYKLRSANVKPN